MGKLTVESIGFVPKGQNGIHYPSLTLKGVAQTLIGHTGGELHKKIQSLIYQLEAAETHNDEKIREDFFNEAKQGLLDAIDEMKKG